MLDVIMGLLRKFYLKHSGLERISPNDWVNRDQIDYVEESNLLTIDLAPNIKIFSIADTNSMDGLMDIGHNVIATDYFDKAKLAVGDVVVFQAGGPLIVHRIVKIREDDSGRIYRTRGDNNVDMDRFHLRNLNIKYLVLGIFY